LKLIDDSRLRQIISSSVTPTLDGALDRILKDILKEINISPANITLKEKADLIRTLELYGIFSFRGAVQSISRYFDISRVTVYKYIKR
jgi:predicted transcriptional regulator YheO